jgi:nucleotide-binding universal stress UspA family protein
MISTVAVGTDGSEGADEAVKLAAELARRYSAKLVLLSAAQGLPGGVAMAGGEHEWALNSRGHVKTLLERSEKALQEEGIECETRSGEGDPADVLVRLAEECGADVLVIGSKGMNRRVLGSIPNTVTHKADCSVMVVKTT